MSEGSQWIMIFGGRSGGGGFEWEYSALSQSQVQRGGVKEPTFGRVRGGKRVRCCQKRRLSLDRVGKGPEHEGRRSMRGGRCVWLRQQGEHERPRTVSFIGSPSPQRKVEVE